MKNAILMVAAMGMFGGVMAASTTVNQPVSATVSNVCTYNVPDMSDVNGQTFTQANKDLGNSNALTEPTVSVAMGQFYIFRCTTGTNWDSPAYAKTGSITLTGSGSSAGSTLSASYKINVLDTTGSDGDMHSAGVDFTIPKGQWTAKAGNYSGALSVTIAYN